MSALAEALLAAQRQAIGAASKSFVARFNGWEVNASVVVE